MAWKTWPRRHGATLRCQEQLIEIREAGLRQVPLIFLCINGNGEKVKRGDETVEAVPYCPILSPKYPEVLMEIVEVEISASGNMVDVQQE